ncbi:hypothetical protein EVA_02685 [gut metagenome]|uniref:Uncharacterized protein n=1 Tax=gut metagenome TaxID=749906 RepID=J9H5I8_9ZZZZ
MDDEERRVTREKPEATKEAGREMRKIKKKGKWVITFH